MEINGNNLSEPVRFYTKNTENLIKRNAENTDISQIPNIFAGEIQIKEKAKLVTSPIKKKRKSKRLNVLDTEYISEDRIEQKQEENIFINKKENKSGISIKKVTNFIFTKIPLINYFFLKNKKKEIETTVAKLNGINQDIDDLMTGSVPFGEDKKYYDDIATNLTTAANIIGKSEKNNK